MFICHIQDMEEKESTYSVEINKMISTVTFSSNRFLFSFSCERKDEILPFCVLCNICECVWEILKIVEKRDEESEGNGALILMIIITDQENKSFNVS